MTFKNYPHAPTPPHQESAKEPFFLPQRTLVAIAGGGAVLLATGYGLVSCGHGENTAAVPTAATSAAAPTPETTVTVTTIPRPEPTKTSAAPTPSRSATAKRSAKSTYPAVSSLRGTVGFIPDGKNPKQKGLIWGKAFTSDNVNFINFSCENGYVESNLAVVSAKNRVIKTYPVHGYPDAQPTPCDGDTVQKSFNITLVYGALLSAALANDTLES